METGKNKKALYVLNGFHQGGAEIGLATLLEHGFMKDVDFRIFAFALGSQNLFDRVARAVGEDRIILVSRREKPTVRVLLLGGLVLFRTIWKFRPSAVILSLKQSNIIGRMVLCLFPSIACVAFEHSTRLDKSKFASFYKVVLGLLSFRVNETWADCQTTLDDTTAFYFWRQKRAKQTVPLFCCARNIPIKKSYNLGSSFRIAIVGRIISGKRHDLVLQTLSRLVSAGISASLTIFGTGDHEARLRQLVRDLHLEDRVVFKGHVDNWWRDAADFDVFVHPSEREGFCIVAAEAMMIGLPVLVSPVGGVRDYSTSGVDALHLSDISCGAIEQGLLTLFNDEALRRRIGEAAARKIASRFSDDSMRKTLSSLTDRLL